MHGAKYTFVLRNDVNNIICMFHYPVGSYGLKASVLNN